MERIDACYNKQNLDQWLFQLRKQPTIWPCETEDKIREVITGLSHLERENLCIAWEAGLLSGAASALSSIPSFGGLIAAPFASGATIHGVKGGFDISRRYAQQSDRRQDLLQETRAFYLQLAVRLLTRYVKAKQLAYAETLEQRYPDCGSLLSEHKVRSLVTKAVVIKVTAEEILWGLPKAEVKAQDLLLGRRSDQFPPVRRWCQQRDEARVQAWKSERARTEKLVSAIVHPLREVCEFIQADAVTTQKARFSFEALSNSKATEESRLQHRIDSVLRERKDARLLEAFEEQNQRIRQLEQELADLKGVTDL